MMGLSRVFKLIRNVKVLRLVNNRHDMSNFIALFLNRNANFCEGAQSIMNDEK